MCFNYNGTFVKAIERQIQQATKAMYSLLTKSRRLCLPIDITCDLFDKTVLPVLIYSCEIWGCGNLNSVEIFYKKFLKIILKLNTSTPSTMIYGEVGKLPIENVIHQRMISYWIKVSEDKHTKYSNIMYRLLYKLHSSGAYTFQWFTKINRLLTSCNFSNLWQDQDQYVTKKFLKTNIFEALGMLQQQKWLEDVNNNRVCYNYRIFKQNLNFENYLVKLPFLYRRNFSKFRCKNNKLPVNKHRFNRNDIDKNCQLCMSGDLGDEFHSLLVCTYFETERKNYLNEYFYTRPNTLKMNELFNSSHQKTLIDLCKFIGLIFDKFK